MAYDKMVDSAVLDGAMTATADAIRTKTGSTEKIPWDEEQGFAAAIAGIATGPENVVDETFTVTSNTTYIPETAALLKGFIPENAVMAKFLWLGDISAAQNYHFLSGAWYPEIRTNNIFFYVRLVDGEQQGQAAAHASSTYSARLSVGDQVRMVAYL